MFILINARRLNRIEDFYKSYKFIQKILIFVSYGF